MEIKVKACNRFVLGHYRTESDAKPVWSFPEKQIMNALNKSKSFNVRDWWGGVDWVKFTITNIEKDEWGDYIYTIESSKPIDEYYFPSIIQICEDYENVASPTSYRIR